jgi:hypothetical protein
MSWPTSRRLFATREWANGNAALAGFWRSIAHWQNYTYDTDLALSPADPKTSTPFSFAWFLWMSVVQPSPVTWADQMPPATTTIPPLRIYVPPPRAPGASKVRVWLYARCALASAGTLQITNERSLSTSLVTVDTAALGGGGATEGWLSADVTVQAHDTLQVTFARTSGVALTDQLSLSGVSAYWLDPAGSGVDLTAAFFPISRAFFSTAYRPDPTYVARWLGLMANRFLAHRSRLQVAASWLDEWAYGDAASQTTRTVLGRYRVLVGAGISSLRFALHMKSSNGGAPQYVTADVQVGGVSIGSTTNSPTNAYTWREFSLAITPTAAVREAEVILTATAAAGQAIYMVGVSIWEETATVALAGADADPGAFVPNEDELIAGGRAMTAALRSALVDNMLWTWKNRGLRHLVSDSRHNAPYGQTDPVTGAPVTITHTLNGDAEELGEYRFRFLGASQVPRFVLYDQRWTVLTNDEADYVWADELAQKAAAATKSRVASNGPPVDVRISRFGNFAALSAATVSIAVWQRPFSSASDMQANRIAGLMVEEAPLHESAGTRT